MNIIITAPNHFPYSFGGIQTYLHGLTAELVRRGHNVTVLTSIAWNRHAGDFHTEKYQHNKINVIAFSINPSAAGAQESHVGFGPLARRVLLNIFTEFRPDIVHINHMEPAFVSVCSELGIPNIVMAHNTRLICPAPPSMQPREIYCSESMSPDICIPCSCQLRLPKGNFGSFLGMIPVPISRWYGEKANYKRKLCYLERGLIYPWLIEQDIFSKRKIIDASEYIVAPSQYIKKRFLKNGYNPKKIALIPHGISPAANILVKRDAAGPVRFGYVGRITPSKGLHLLLEAASLLSQESACEIHIFGSAQNAADKEYSGKILAGYSGRTPLYNHGSLSHDVRYAAFEAFDVLVVPSITPEAFGLVVSEAFSTGLPVIAAKAGGLAELVRDGVDGFMVENNNARLLSTAMQKFIGNPELITELAARVPHVKTTASYACEIESLYNKMLSPRSQALL